VICGAKPTPAGVYPTDTDIARELSGEPDPTESTPLMTFVEHDVVGEDHMFEGPYGWRKLTYVGKSPPHD
jgi:hypothetical protein